MQKMCLISRQRWGFEFCRVFHYGAAAYLADLPPTTTFLGCKWKLRFSTPSWALVGFSGLPQPWVFPHWPSSTQASSFPRGIFLLLDRPLPHMWPPASPLPVLYRLPFFRVKKGSTRLANPPKQYSWRGIWYHSWGRGNVVWTYSQAQNA